jgi:hypothetical protein
MPGYYDRLEGQLVEATQRGLRHRLLARPRRMPRLRTEWLAVTVSLAVCVVVALVFVGVGGRQRSSARLHVSGAGLAVIRDYAPGNLPPLSGQMVCDTTLKAPSGAGSPSGTVVVNAESPAGFVFSVRAAGLERATGTSVYAVWIVPAVNTTLSGYQLTGGAVPEFVGVIRPSVGGGGMLAAEGRLPRDATGTYQIRLTLQNRPSATAQGRTVLKGFISF